MNKQLGCTCDAGTRELKTAREHADVLSSSPSFTMPDQPKPMTGSDAARIQAAEAKQGDAGAQKSSFAARAQSAAAKNDVQGGQQAKK